MKLEKAQSIIDGYADWWRKSVAAYQEGNAIRLVCPMLDRHNDHMSLYIVEDNDSGGYLISDLGYTISDLELSGCDILKSTGRSKKLEELLSGFGVSLADHEMYVHADERDLFQRMNMLMQGMASVDDLFFTMRDSVRNLFLEDVAQWLYDHDIRYTKNARFSGRSGFETKFDFVIPATPKVAPERLIKTVGTPSEASVKNALFGWNDISAVRGDSLSYLFLNAEANPENSVEPSLLRACDAYDVRPVIWNGSADSVLNELAA